MYRKLEIQLFEEQHSQCPTFTITVDSFNLSLYWPYIFPQEQKPFSENIFYHVIGQLPPTSYRHY